MVAVPSSSAIVATGAAARKEERASRSPPSTDSSRKAPSSSSRRKALTGVSQSASSSLTTGTRSWSAASARTASSEGRQLGAVVTAGGEDTVDGLRRRGLGGGEVAGDALEGTLQV